MALKQADAVGSPSDQDGSAGTDAPVVALLQDIDLLKKPGAQQGDWLTGHPDPSVAVIEACATALAKGWSAALAAGFAGTAVIAALEGVWGGAHDSVRIAIVAGAAVILAALGLAMGLIVSTDVRSRAVGAAATIQARAQVASAFLTIAKGASVAGNGAVADVKGPASLEVAKQPPADGVGDSPRLTSLTSTRFTAYVASGSTVVPLTVVAMGTDDDRNTWYHVVQDGRQAWWIPMKNTSAAAM